MGKHLRRSVEHLAYPEGRAALAAARRRDRLGEQEHREALAALEELNAGLVTVGVDQEVVASAGAHAEDLGLRGYDAVHLATALELGDEEIVLVTRPEPQSVVVSMTRATIHPMTQIANESLIAEAGRRLKAAAPDARVILFGSYARGEAKPGSDLDLLVVEPRLSSRRKEFGRLRMALGDIGVPVDLIVVSDDHVSKWGEVPGGVIHEALRDGRVLTA